LPLASLSSGLPGNPNVLLIRTHPNPTPSVANTSDLSGLDQGDPPLAYAVGPLSTK
jgi:hypothetical protein